MLPAIGTHTPMRPDQIAHMFGKMPQDLFRVHNWRTDIETLGELPAEFIREQSEGKLNYTWPAQVNKLISQGGFDLILSIGQVVPHEVIGMANHAKNILIGTGGREGINRSHYLGAVYGMERIMGRAENPVRNVLNRACEKFLRHLPIVYVQTVVGRGKNGGLAVRGLYIGDDLECFLKAAELSLKVNFEMLDEPIKKAVVYLDPEGVPQHLDRQQGGLSHAHGAGRRSGADYSCAGREGIRRRQGNRRADPQVWLSRNAGHAEGGERECRSGCGPERGRAPDSCFVGRAVQDSSGARAS